MRGLAWLAVYGYARTLVLRWVGRHCESRQAVGRWLWTGGCFALALHLLLALAVEHAWSYQAAYEHIAERTDQYLGWRFGEGLYVNFLFLLTWMADVVWWWCWPQRYARRSSVAEWLVQGWLALIMVNAAIVFASATGRWIALGIVVLALIDVPRLARGCPQG